MSKEPEGSQKDVEGRAATSTTSSTAFSSSGAEASSTPFGTPFTSPGYVFGSGFTGFSDPNAASQLAASAPSATPSFGDGSFSHLPSFFPFRGSSKSNNQTDTTFTTEPVPVTTFASLSIDDEKRSDMPPSSSDTDASSFASAFDETKSDTLIYPSHIPSNLTRKERNVLFAAKCEYEACTILATEAGSLERAMEWLRAGAALQIEAEGNVEREGDCCAALAGILSCSGKQFLLDEAAIFLRFVKWKRKIWEPKAFFSQGDQEICVDLGQTAAQRCLVRTLLSGHLSKNSQTALHTHFFRSPMREARLLPIISGYIVKGKENTGEEKGLEKKRNDKQKNEATISHKPLDPKNKGKVTKSPMKQQKIGAATNRKPLLKLRRKGGSKTKNCPKSKGTATTSPMKQQTEEKEREEKVLAKAIAIKEQKKKEEMKRGFSKVEQPVSGLNNISKLLFLNRSQMKKLTLNCKSSNAPNFLHALLPLVCNGSCVTDLKFVDWKDIDLSVLSRIDQQSNIESLEVCGSTDLKSLTSLSRCVLPSLKKIYIYNDRFAHAGSLKSLDGLTKENTQSLAHLEIHHNPVSDISALSACDLSSLQVLMIEDCKPLVDWSCLKQCQFSSLTKLSLQSLKNLNDISVFNGAYLSNLKWLCLNDTNVSDLSPLCEWSGFSPSLLSFSNCPIVDLSPLARIDLSSLEHTISLAWTKVSDDSPLKLITYPNVKVRIDETPLVKQVKTRTDNLKVGLVSLVYEPELVTVNHHPPSTQFEQFEFSVW